MNRIEQALHYINENKLSNEFTQKLQDQYTTKQYLSVNQYECLDRICEDHKFISRVMKSVGDNSSDFLKSLKSQFETRGFLTKKQIDILKLCHN